MATPDRDTVYTNDGTNRTVYTRENNSTGWFVGIIVALALLAIAYLVFSANSQPASTTVDLNNTPAVTTPVVPMAPASIAPTAPADTTATPSVAPSAPATSSAAPTASSALESSAPAPASSAQ